jgi:hypothetical protein
MDYHFDKCADILHQSNLNLKKINMPANKSYKVCFRTDLFFIKKMKRDEY